MAHEKTKAQLKQAHEGVTYYEQAQRDALAMPEGKERTAAIANAEGSLAVNQRKVIELTEALRVETVNAARRDAIIAEDNDREAAIVAAREAELEAQRVAEVLAIRQDKLNTRRGAVHDAGAAWDKALSGLVDATNRLVEAGQSFDAIACDGVDGVIRGPVLDRAQIMALDIVKWRLRNWTGTHVMSIPSEKITGHLF